MPHPLEERVQQVAQRVSRLKTGGGLNGSYLLTTGGPSPTLTGDSSADAVTGGNGRDWFLSKSGQDAVSDLNLVTPESGPETVTRGPRSCTTSGAAWPRSQALAWAS